MMKKIKVISCILTVAVMALIFFFSSQTADVSSMTSRGFTKKIVEFVCSIIRYNNPDFIINIIHAIMRKVAHFTLFFLLGITSVNSICRLFEFSRKKLFIYSLLFCILYAVSDEVHQIFVPGRAAMFKDVCIDSAGSVFGISLFILVRTIIVRRKKNGI